MKNSKFLLRFLNIIIAFFVIFICIFLFIEKDANDFDAKISFGKNDVFVEIFDDLQKRQNGLMMRDFLAKDRGALFVFEEMGYNSFWMKNTLIPLDMIWLDDQYKILDIQTAAPCVTEVCDVYKSFDLSKYVIEVNAGFAVDNDVQIGDIVSVEYFNN